MSTAANRNSIIDKTYKVLKKHYKPALAPGDRTVLGHLLYACCLEDERFESADEAFAKLQESYYDWNEVRVTTITELSESMKSLNDPMGAASRLKKSLQGIFETNYDFDIDILKKQNVGKAVKELQRCGISSEFVIGYVTQHGFAGHAIPLSGSSLEVMYVVGVASESDLKKHRVTGLERAVNKSKGYEFASLLHQLSADYVAAKFSTRIRAILTEINPEAKDRLPKRDSKKTKPEPETSKKSEQASAKKAEPTSKSEKKPTEKNTTPEKTNVKKTTPAKKKPATKKLSKKKPR
ncbi:MAG: hypothetical protein ACI9HK_004428 [Pirellulaceae bacterium]|jgi:hypothetical protein